MDCLVATKREIRLQKLIKNINKLIGQHSEKTHVENRYF